MTAGLKLKFPAYWTPREKAMVIEPMAVKGFDGLIEGQNRQKCIRDGKRCWL